MDLVGETDGLITPGSGVENLVMGKNAYERGTYGIVCI